LDKTIVCKCEDITKDDVRKAIEEGYQDIESLKRYTGIMTGACQGKFCQCLLIEVMQELNVNEKNFSSPMTSRPPIFSTPLKYFAAKEKSTQGESEP
jgi:bacterioferritin-associated ferredoxin